MIENPRNTLPNKWLDLDTCKLVYSVLTRELEFYSDLPAFSMRYPGRLESILNSVRQTYDGNYLNRNIIDAYVSYFYQIVKGHPFIDGNKRTGVLFSHVFLLDNDYNINRLKYVDMYNLAIVVAESTDEFLARDLIKRVITQFVTMR